MVSTRRSGSGGGEGDGEEKLKGQGKRAAGEDTSKDSVTNQNDTKPPRSSKRQKGKQKVDPVSDSIAKNQNPITSSEPSGKGPLQDKFSPDQSSQKGSPTGGHLEERDKRTEQGTAGVADQAPAGGSQANLEVPAGSLRYPRPAGSGLPGPSGTVKSTVAAVAGWLKNQKHVTSAVGASLSWGTLISQYAQHPHVPLGGLCFTIGRSRGCNLQLKDPSVSGILCNIWFSPIHSYRGVILENLGSNGILQVNGKTLPKGIKLVIKGGDELLFNCRKSYSYIYQQFYPMTAVSGWGEPHFKLGKVSADVLRAAANSPGDAIASSSSAAFAGQPPADASTTSAPAQLPAEILAMYSAMKLRTSSGQVAGPSWAAEFGDLTAALTDSVRVTERGAPQTSPATTAGDDVAPNKRAKTAAGASGMGVCGEGDERRKDNGISVEGVTPVPDTAKPADIMGQQGVAGGALAENSEVWLQSGAGRGVGVGSESEFSVKQIVIGPKLLAKNRSTRGRTKRANSTEAQGETGVGTSVDDRRNLGGLGEGPVLGLGLGLGAGLEEGGASEFGQAKAVDEMENILAGTASKKRILIDEFRKALEENKHFEASFESFPYYLSESTKSVLIATCYVHLECQKFSQFLANLPSMSSRILLAGPLGSELLQEKLVRALSAHFKAGLLMYAGTSSLLTPQDDAGVSGRVEQSSTAVLTLSPDTSGVDVAKLDASEPDTAKTDAAKTDIPPQGTAGEVPKQTDLTNEEATAVTLAKLANSKRTLRKGDRVKYVGPMSSAGGPGSGQVASVHTYLCSVNPLDGPNPSDRPTVRGPAVGHKGRVVLVFEENPRKVGVRFDRPIPGGTNLANLCPDGYGFFCNVSDLQLDGVLGEDNDKVHVDALFEVLEAEGSKGPVVLFVKDVEKSVLANGEHYTMFKRKLDKLEGRVVVIAGHTVNDIRKEKVSPGGFLLPKLGGAAAGLLDLSFLGESYPRFEERNKEPSKNTKMLVKLFPSRIPINPPQDPELLAEWKRKLEKDMAIIKGEANRQQLKTVLAKNRLECEGLSTLNFQDPTLTLEAAEKVVGWAASRHLMTCSEPAVKGNKLFLSVDSLEEGLKMFQTFQSEQGTPGLTKILKEIVPDNEFEKRILGEVIPPAELGVAFDDIGALEHLKTTLKELVMLPLQRPELFCKGQLTKACKGILLFGPPGTGKTMLAKAVATEAGANFINISMSAIASKWFGEGEKYVKAVFTLASRIAPSVIFIDEVDSMLGRRERPGEHEAMRKMKNEFMGCWDGLRTKTRERVLVLAATNRPFDLDDAVVRRFPRRLMVDLPDQANRAKILQVILGKEDLGPRFDVGQVASATEGFSGSDLKNLCVTAAYRPIREILQKERQARDAAALEGREEALPLVELDSKAPLIRPLCWEDFQHALQQVSASVSLDSNSLQELSQWNDLYGDGGSRKRTTLTYFM